MEHDKLIKALRDGCPVTECAWCDFSGESDCECKLGPKAAELMEALTAENAALTAQFAEKSKQ